MTRVPSTKLSTAVVISLILDGKTKWIEVSLNNGVFNATHLLFNGKHRLIDVGTDSSEVRWKPRDFLNFYRDARWKVDQMSME